LNFQPHNYTFNYGISFWSLSVLEESILEIKKEMLDCSDKEELHILEESLADCREELREQMNIMDRIQNYISKNIEVN